jgi:hypothetical protein
MQERKKVLSIILEVIGLSILTLAAYFGSNWLLRIMLGSFLPNLEQRLNISFFSPLTFFIMVLVFDILWIATIKFWPLKNIHIKIALTLLVVAFNAAYAPVVIAGYMLRDFHW